MKEGQPTTPEDYLDFVNKMQQSFDVYMEKFEQLKQERQEPQSGPGVGLDLTNMLGGGSGEAGAGGASSLGSYVLPVGIFLGTLYGAITGKKKKLGKLNLDWLANLFK